MGKPVTVQDLRCGHGLHEALFNAKYQKYMKFAIMFENSPRWGTTDSQDIVDHLMPFWMENYFKKDNYLKIDNKPVLMIFNPNRLVGVWPNPEDQRKAFDACREYAKKEGFDGMLFGVCNASVKQEDYEAQMERGYDFRFGYASGYIPEESFPEEDEIVAGQCKHFDEYLALDPMRHVGTATCFRDASPRTTPHWINMGYNFHKEKKFYLSPERFREVLRHMKEEAKKLPDGAIAKNLIMIDNWNEWDEGHFVSPSYQFGYKYLQAVREELTARDNLPDYRTPQDLGLDGYNTSWEIPDFTEVCKKKLEK